MRKTFKVKDEFIGKVGAPERDEFETELKADLIRATKRQEKNKASHKHNWKR